MILMSDKEVKSLQEILGLLNPSRILEIGTGYGGSAVEMAKVCPDAYIVTIDSSPPEPETLQVFLADYSHIKFIQAPSSVATLTSAMRLAGGTFDFVFVDGDHSYEGVLADIDYLLQSFVLADSAFLLFHDVHYDPVKRAIDDAVDKQPELRHFGWVCYDPNPDEKGNIWGGLWGVDYGN